MCCKDSANKWNDKTKYAVFVFQSRVQPILFKDSANERNVSSLTNCRVQLILFKDSANERNDKTEAELIENITIFRL